MSQILIQREEEKYVWDVKQRFKQIMLRIIWLEITKVFFDSQLLMKITMQKKTQNTTGKPKQLWS